MRKERKREFGIAAKGVDEGCGATKRKRTEKGETDREEGKERRRTRETESEGHGGSERRIKKKPTGGKRGTSKEDGTTRGRRGAVGRDERGKRRG